MLNKDQKNIMNTTIRLMTVDDYSQVHRVDILTQKQYLGTKFDQMSKKEQDSHLVSRKSEFQINVDSGYCFVALNNKKIIGFLLAYETLPFRNTLYIHYIGVNPKTQGKGIGLLLYQKLIKKAKQAGIKKIWSLINIDNPQSMKLHEKIGFKLNDRKEAILDMNKC